MTPLKTAALALTLIIVTPILLGFGMASEDVERTVTTTERTGSLSEVVLNSTTPYYVSYSGANNNSYLYGSDASLVVPDFVETSATTYTYTPIYDVVSGSVTMPTPVSVTYSSTDYSTVGTGSYSPDAVLPTFVSAKFTITESSEFAVHTEDGWYAEQLSSGDVVYAMTFDTDDFVFHVGGLDGVGSDQDCNEIYITLGAVTFEYVSDFTALSIDADPWSADISDGCLSLEVDGDSSYVDATGILYSGGTYTVSKTDGTTVDWTGVTGIALAPGVSLDYESSSGSIVSYADVSYGWQLPSDSTYYYWFNGYENDYLRLMVHIESGETLYIGDEYSDTPSIALVSTDGFVTLSVEGEDAVDIGTYTNLMVEIHIRNISYDDGYVEVTGIYEWPSIGTAPSLTYNSVSVDFGSSFVFAFTTVYVEGSDSVEIRADASGIYAGEYPSTYNYSYHPYELFPSDDWQSIVIDSVGVYGYAISVRGGYSLISEDNTVTFTDIETSESFTSSVLGLTVTFRNNDGTYETYVDGHLISESSSAPFLRFENVWSLTLHRTVTTEETVIMSEWVPGQFAFDKDDFILITILATVGVFVALGLYKGTRVGVLAVVCGAAGIIAFVIA